MGTYFELQLKNTSEKNIKGINESLIKLGYKNSRTEDPIYKGAFVTRELLKAEAKFMNEDPEGLKQLEHYERPITIEFLQTFVWNRLGIIQAKLSNLEGETPELTRELIENLIILSKFYEDNPDLFDLKKCHYCNMGKVLEYADPVLERLLPIECKEYTDNRKMNNEAPYGQDKDEIKCTIVIRIKNGLAEVDMSTIPKGIEVEIRDYDINDPDPDEVFNDQQGDYIRDCFCREGRTD